MKRRLSAAMLSLGLFACSFNPRAASPDASADGDASANVDASATDGTSTDATVSCTQGTSCDDMNVCTDSTPASVEPAAAW